MKKNIYQVTLKNLLMKLQQIDKIINKVLPRLVRPRTIRLTSFSGGILNEKLLEQVGSA